jgi:hypothetical protein
VEVVGFHARHHQRQIPIWGIPHVRAKISKWTAGTNAGRVHCVFQISGPVRKFSEHMPFTSNDFVYPTVIKKLWQMMPLHLHSYVQEIEYGVTLPFVLQFRLIGFYCSSLLSSMGNSISPFGSSSKVPSSWCIRISFSIKTLYTLLSSFLSNNSFKTPKAVIARSRSENGLQN